MRCYKKPNEKKPLKRSSWKKDLNLGGEHRRSRRYRVGLLGRASQETKKRKVETRGRPQDSLQLDVAQPRQRCRKDPRHPSRQDFVESWRKALDKT